MRVRINMDEIVLSRHVDEFVPKSRWIASLSNGETIFDDNRKEMMSAWRRLALYVKENGLSITNLRLKIGAREVTLPSHQEGYLWKHKFRSTGSWSQLNYCIGYCQGGLALIHEVSEDGSSHTIHCIDPGEPVTIYRSDKHAIAKS